MVSWHNPLPCGWNSGMLHKHGEMSTGLGIKTHTPLFQDIQMLYRRWVEDRVVTFDDAETDGAKDDAETDEAGGSRHTSAH